MHVVVCLKQVPSVAALKFDPESKTLQREGVPLEINSFDLRALVWAAQLKQSHPETQITAVTLGPPQAREALIDALALGADRGVLLSDPNFRGSDTLATARALTAFLRSNPADLILCGRYSVDAETSQVGPEVAELLAVPHVSLVQRITLAQATPSVLLEVERETDSGWERLQVVAPALLTVTESLAPERFPSKSERERAATQSILQLSAADLGLRPEDIGFAGSPTWVRELVEVPSSRRQLVLTEENLRLRVAKLASILVEEYGAFRVWRVPAPRAFAPAPPLRIQVEPKDVLVLGEVRNGSVHPVTWELVGKATELSSSMGGKVHVALLTEERKHFEGALREAGIDRVIIVSGAACSSYLPWEHAARLVEIIRRVRPRFVLGPSTAYGRDVLPRVAARLGLGLTADCIDLGVGADGSLIQYKPAFGGSIVAAISSRTLPEMATIRPGVFPTPDASGTRPARAQVEHVDAGAPENNFHVRRLDYGLIADLGADLERAEVVVGIGKGLGQEGIETARQFAQRLGAALCTTRDVADEGWLPRQLQVGLTGRSIAPKLYLALAIRGAFEHMVGVRRAGVIVAVNRNPRAPIFRQSDLGLVADVHEALPLLEEEILKRLDATEGK
ncbi:Caffeyl-CoA reductase-Etf complex subunit CarE [bacterium HR30]|nr:Caffeyl-CoA reductase-Etf complex subunit CarE [bacterium HR30]